MNEFKLKSRSHCGKTYKEYKRLCAVIDDAIDVLSVDVFEDIQTMKDLAKYREKLFDIRENMDGCRSTRLQYRDECVKPEDRDIGHEYQIYRARALTQLLDDQLIDVAFRFSVFEKEELEKTTKNIASIDISRDESLSKSSSSQKQQKKTKKKQKENGNVDIISLDNVQKTIMEDKLLNNVIQEKRKSTYDLKFIIDECISAIVPLVPEIIAKSDIMCLLVLNRISNYYFDTPALLMPHDPYCVSNWMALRDVAKQLTKKNIQDAWDRNLTIELQTVPKDKQSEEYRKYFDFMIQRLSTGSVYISIISKHSQSKNGRYPIVSTSVNNQNDTIKDHFIKFLNTLEPDTKPFNLPARLLHYAKWKPMNPQSTNISQVEDMKPLSWNMRLRNAPKNSSGFPFLIFVEK